MEIHPPVGKENAPPSGATVLLVDDDPSVRSFIQTYLQSSGFRTVAAASGNEAMRVLNQECDSIGLVLTDLRMPNISGIELAKLVRQSKPDTPIIFMSGYWDQSVDEFRDVRFLQKPLDLNHMVAAISESLESAARPRGQSFRSAGGAAY
jgi:DNA-binding NtrC family response regulator